MVNQKTRITLFSAIRREAAKGANALKYDIAVQRLQSVRLTEAFAQDLIAQLERSDYSWFHGEQ